jgi:hypothetical protein
MADRFQLVAVPPIAPGTDIITGTTVGPFVDCGAWVPPSPHKRRIYLSVDTIKALALAAGISEPAVDEATIAKYRAEGALDFLKENLHGDLVRAVRRLAAFLDDAGVADDSGEPANTGDPGDEER